VGWAWSLGVAGGSISHYPPGASQRRPIKRRLAPGHLTCAPMAEYPVSNGGSGPEGEHPPTPMSASRMRKRKSLRNPADALHLDYRGQILFRVRSNWERAPRPSRVRSGARRRQKDWRPRPPRSSQHRRRLALEPSAAAVPVEEADQVVDTGRAPRANRGETREASFDEVRS
jgi:hypothetical protein